MNQATLKTTSLNPKKNRLSTNIFHANTKLRKYFRRNVNQKYANNSSLNILR